MPDLVEVYQKAKLNTSNFEMNVDIVFVIDATLSMQKLIDKVKDSALTFHEKLTSYISELTGRKIRNLRIKVIWFRDFYFDGQFAYGESEFFVLPEEQQGFFDFVSGIQENGGYDDPESSLEALTLAMRSDFTQAGIKKRHVVVLFTDSSAHAFEDYDEMCEKAAVEQGCQPEMYPEDMPQNISQFYRAWQGFAEEQHFFAKNGKSTMLDPKDRRLVLFAPDLYPWKGMENELEHTIRKTIKAQNGGADIDLVEIFAMIANSL